MQSLSRMNYFAAARLGAAARSKRQAAGYSVDLMSRRLGVTPRDLMAFELGRGRLGGEQLALLDTCYQKRN